MGSRRVEFQKVRTISTLKPPGESAYWDYQKGQQQGGDTEDIRANPDSLEFDDSNLLWPTKKTDNVLGELKDLDFASLLTKQELLILSLHVEEGLSVEDISKIVTGMSKRKIEYALSRAGNKIKDYYLEKKKNG